LLLIVLAEDVDQEILALEHPPAPVAPVAPVAPKEGQEPPYVLAKSWIALGCAGLRWDALVGQPDTFHKIHDPQSTAASASDPIQFPPSGGSWSTKITAKQPTAHPLAAIAKKLDLHGPY
jgi:hypothetical protein